MADEGDKGPIDRIKDALGMGDDDEQGATASEGGSSGLERDDVYGMGTGATAETGGGAGAGWGAGSSGVGGTSDVDDTSGYGTGAGVDDLETGRGTDLDTGLTGGSGLTGDDDLETGRGTARDDELV